MCKTLNVLRYAIIIIFSVIIFHSCKEDSMDDTPVVFTGSVQEITTTGVTFTGKISGISGKKFVECGFAWSNGSVAESGTSDYYSISDYPGDNPFSATIKSTFVSGKTYSVRTYCRTKAEIIYGQSVSFVSKGSEGPVISNISPSEGFIGDTILISGRNFSNINSSVNVSFKNTTSTTAVTAAILKASFDTLAVVVPLAKSLSQTICVKTGSVTKNSDTPFNILTPTVESFIPTSFFISDTITIYGTGLDKNRSSFAVKFGTAAGSVLKEINKSYIKVLVPTSVTTATGDITFTASLTSITLKNYSILTPSVTSFSPATFSMGDTITIYGTDLNKTKPLFNVTFGYDPGKILSETSRDYIKVVVPTSLTSATGKITFKSKLTSITLPDSYNIITPELTSFSPASFYPGDTITLYGSNLKIARSSYQVRFGYTYGTVLNQINENYIRVVVPDFLNSATGDIVFTSQINSVTLHGYTLLTPAATSYYPTTFYPNDTITIYGTDLEKSRPSLRVYFSSSAAVILPEVNKSYLKVVVPGNLTASTGEVTFSSSAVSTPLPSTYTVLPPEIYSIEPVSFTSGTPLKVTGIGFSQSDPDNNSLVVNNVSTASSSSSKKIAYFTLVHNNITFTSRQFPAYVKVGAGISSAKTLEINDRWLRMPYVPEGYNYIKAFSNGTEAFVLSGASGLLYKYFSSGSYTGPSYFPGPERNDYVAFIIGNYLYFGLGNAQSYDINYLNDFWAYDINAGTWEQLKGFPGPGRRRGIGFSVDKYGYVTGGARIVNDSWTPSDDCWKYDPSTDTWEQLADYANLVTNDKYSYMDPPAAVVTPDNMVYLCGRELLKFNPYTKVWTLLSNYPVQENYNSYYGFFYNNKLYLGDSDRRLYIYDPVSNTWNQETTGFDNGNLYHSSAIILDNKIIIGFGYQSGVWEFDPSR